MTRKCEYCKRPIDIHRGNLDKVIYFDKKNYHVDCFGTQIEKKLARKNIKQDSRELWEYAQHYRDEIIANTRKTISTQLAKDDIYSLMLNNYDIGENTKIPQHIWMRLASIYNTIPPEQLLDMWKQKMNYLKKNRAVKASRGEPLDWFSSISYDLTVLFNKYDSYLKWLQKQAVHDLENRKDKQLNEGISFFISNVAKEKLESNNDGDEDISNLVDDIFG